MQFIKDKDLRFAEDIFYYDDVIFTQCAFINHPVTQNMNYPVIFHTEYEGDRKSTFNSCFTNFDKLVQLRRDGRRHILFIRNYAEKHRLSVTSWVDQLLS